MVWKNNLKKMMRMNTTKIRQRNAKRAGIAMAAMLGNLRDAIDKAPRTSNPQGKRGMLEFIPTWERKFIDGNRKWKWNLFNKSVFNDGRRFAKGLEKRGFKVLGGGHFSTVLGKDGYNKVIKVSHKIDNWIDYIRWAHARGTQFAPKVYSFKRIKGKKADFTVAVIERLEYTLDQAPKDHAMKILPGLLSTAHYTGHAMAAKFSDILAPGLLTFVKDIIAKFGEDRFDFHNGNMMLRKNGDFVIIDPIAGEDTGKFTRLRSGDFGLLAVLQALLIGFRG